ncbi:MAG: T9SS type A sorting domain-containing protein [Bacteroidota bacterium]
MKKLFTLLSAVLLLGTKLFAQLTGGTTYPINGVSSAPTSFATIQEAATYLLSTGVSGTGNVILELGGSYLPSAEPATGINFDTIMGATAARRVILRPATGFSTTVSGTIAGGAMLSLRGTQFLTIEGRKGGTGTIGLTITNLSTATTDSTSAIKFTNGVSNVILSNCIVRGSSKSVSIGGVILIGKGSATAGNQVNIESCSIDGMGAAHNGITLNGNTASTTLENTGDTIRNCNIYDFFDNTGTSGTAAIRIQQGVAGVTITGNSIYQTATRAFTAQFLTFGILVGAGTYYTTDYVTITNNYIGGSGPLATGTMNLTAASVVAGYSAIFMNYANGIVTGNTIKNINASGNSSAGTFTNPAIFASVFFNGTCTISNNTIDSFSISNTAGPVTTSGIHIATQLDTTFVKNISPLFTVQGNTIKNITATPSSTGNGQVFGIRAVPVTTTGQGGNLYYNNTNITINQNTIDGMRSMGISTSSYSFGVWGSAANGGTSTHFVRLIPTITNNTIKNIICSGAIVATGYPAAGGVVILNAHTSNATYTDTLKIRSNTIQDIYGLNTGDLNTAVGAIFTNLGRPDISGNKIFNIYNKGNASVNNPYVYGINIFNLASPGSADNNFISLGDTATFNQSAFGIMHSTSATAALSTSYNTILVSGGASSKNSACIGRSDAAFTGNTTTFTVKNNLLINRRSGAGINVALAIPGTGLFTSDNNTMITAATAAAAYYNTTTYNFSAWKLSTGADAYSYYAQYAATTNLSTDPATLLLSDLFSGANYSSQANFLVNNLNAASWLVYGKGQALSSLSTDFAGNVRGTTSGTPTCIGANEFTTTTTAPANVITGNIAVADSSVVKFAGRDMMKVYWLSGTMPSSVSSRYFSGKIHPNYTSGNKGGSYYTLAATGGSGYKYKVQLSYGPHEIGNITNGVGNTRITQYITNWSLAKEGQAFTSTKPQSVITDSLSQVLSSTLAYMLTDNISPLADIVAISNNTISGASIICSGTTPTGLTGALPTGGNNTYTYTWLSSTTSATAGFSAIASSNTQNYSPGALTVSTWYRRYVVSATVSDTSAAIKVDINLNSTWNGSMSTDWSDPDNWSNGVVPCNNSNVTIPALSFNYPIVNTAITLNNLTINSGGTLTLTGVTAQLNIVGAFTNNGTFTNTSTGKTVFSGSVQQTIPAGNYTKVQINNPAGAILGGLVVLSDSLLLTNGILYLDAINLTLGVNSYASAGSATSFIKTNGTGSVTVNGVGSTGKTGSVIIPVGNTTFNPVVLLNAGTTDNYTVRLFDSVTANYTGSSSTGTKLTSNALNRTWIINEGTAGGSNATVTLQWNTADELSGFNRALCYVARYNGTVWTSTTAATAIGSNPYTQTRSGITSFSPFSVGSGGTLPVELINFKGEENGNKVLLTWATASEINNDYFTVERSFDNVNFTAIGTVKGAGTSSRINTYNFTDIDAIALAQPTLYYRLKQVDMDGTFTYSTIVVINLNKGNHTVETITPNPFDNTLKITFNGNKTVTHVQVKITDINGRIVSERTISSPVGIQFINLDNLANLTTGMYNVLVVTNGETNIYKVVKN